jgi:hypothetical protein
MEENLYNTSMYSVGKVVIDNMSEFKIEKVDALPSGTRTASKVYNDIVTDINKQPVGVYKITLGNKKPSTLYQQLAKLLKGNKTMKLSKIKNVVYIEKIVTKKT